MNLASVVLAMALNSDNSQEESGIPEAYRIIANQKMIPSKILFAVALTESGASIATGRYLPWPWSLNIDKQAYRFASRKAAFHVLKEAIKKGKSVDVGVMQVNWYWHHKRFSNPWSALDPHMNLQVGAEILFEQYKTHKDWWLAVGAYHAPGNDVASKKRAAAYAGKVSEKMESLYAST